jgi:hypothetical protein
MNRGVSGMSPVASKEFEELCALSLVLPGIFCFFKRLGWRASLDSPVVRGGMKRFDNFRSFGSVMTLGGLDAGGLAAVPSGWPAGGEVLVAGAGRSGVAAATVAVVAGGSAAY